MICANAIFRKNVVYILFFLRKNAVNVPIFLRKNCVCYKITVSLLRKKTDILHAINLYLAKSGLAILYVE